MANGTAAKTPSANTGEGFMTRFGKSRFGRFLIDSWVETFQKSSWPSRKELTSFTIVVLFALLVVGGFIGILDGVMSKITEWIRIQVG